MPLFACCQFKQLVQKGLFKTLLIMNLTTVFLFAICLSVNAEVFSQKVSLSEKNSSLEKVFKEINRQTNYTFVYTESLLKKSKSINLKVQNASIDLVLEMCLKEQPLTYNIVNKMVVIREKAIVLSKVISPTILTPPLVPIVTGRVKDEKGQPLVGVSITIAGKSSGVSTDERGFFSIDVPENAELIFSYVGYKTMRESVKGKSRLEITLSPDILSLDDVVIVGFGTQKKVTVVGAIT